MASVKSEDFLAPNFVLSPHQQNLLFAALNSNRASTNSLLQDADADTIAPATFDTTAPLQAPVDRNLTNLDENPFIDYDYDFDNEASYGDFDFSGLPQGQAVGGLPSVGTPSDGDVPTHDKRGLSDEDENEDEPEGKRRDGDDKTSKKPGRKPLTSEPTSKRKAQNRAAQRAFRERKEKHLKDLETKVQDLEKASEAANHENLILRAKVEKMTRELNEYKESSAARNQNAHNPNATNFSFEFPKFGRLPGPPVLSKPDSRVSRATTSPGDAPSRSTSFTSNISPVDNRSHPSLNFGLNQGLGSMGQSNGSNFVAPYGTGFHGIVGDSFDYRTVPKNSSSSSSTADSGSGPSSTGHNTSQSSPASSNSHHGTTSSCDTSPEPCMQSPPPCKNDNNLITIGEEAHQCSLGNENAFGDKISQLSGTASQPIPHTMAPADVAQTPNFDITSLDWLAAQNNNQFDPQLFGDYREPHDNILTGGLYDDTFFNEAFTLAGDLSSPFTLDAVQLQHPQSQPQSQQPTPQMPPASTSTSTSENPQCTKRNLINEIDAQIGGADEVVSAGNDTLTCNNVWKRVQACSAVQNGDIDMESLCSELQKKAKCSGGGPVIQETDFKDVLDNMFSPANVAATAITTSGYKPYAYEK